MDTGTFSAVAGSIPVLVSIPHAGTRRFGDCGREDTGIIAAQKEKLADLHVDEVGLELSSLLGRRLGGRPYVLSSGMTRMECDIERYPDDREEMNAVGMGVVYTRGIDGEPLYASPLPDDIRRRRIDALYRPYHLMLTAFAREILRDHGRCVLIDLHSYSARPLGYELHSSDARPQVCIGVNSRGEEPEAFGLADAAHAATGLGFGVNETFRGSIVPNGMNPDEIAGIRSVMFEIRKDAYLHGDDTVDADGVRRVARFIDVFMTES